MAIGDGDDTNGVQIAAPVRPAARKLPVKLKQSAYGFRPDPLVQYAVAVLSSNTLYGPHPLLFPL